MSNVEVPARPVGGEHGTQTAYVGGCRCQKCKNAQAAYMRAYRAANKEKFLEVERARAKTPERQAYRRKYSREKAAEIAVKSREFRRANLELYAAYESRRRVKRYGTLDASDIEISVEYRKAIVNDPCLYCGAEGEQDDHYFAVAKGGTDIWYNLVRACKTCNNAKNDRCGTWFLLRAGKALA